MRSILVRATALAILVVGGAVAPARAEVDLGVRGGYYFDVGEPFLGGELLMPVVGRRIYFNPNLEWVFTEGVDYLTINGDFHYDFPVSGPNYVWAGAGLGLVRIDPEGPGSDTDPALNLLAGVGFRRRGVIPYFQAKVILKDDTEFVLAFGLRF